MDGNLVITIISLIFGLLGGGGAFITWLLYRKQTERFKTAEAFEKEVVALRTTIETLKTQAEFYERRLDEMQKLIIGKDDYIHTLTDDRHTIEVKHAKNKTAINAAYSCSFCDDKANCPVLIQRAKNEANYLRRITKEEK